MGKILFAIALAIIAIISFLLILIIYKILKIWKKKPEIGTLIGEECEASENIKSGNVGKILFRGEIWSAIAEEDIKKGDKLIIVGKENWHLRVRKK